MGPLKIYTILHIANGPQQELMRQHRDFERHHNQLRIAVAETNAKRAAKLLGVSASHFRDYGYTWGTAEDLPPAYRGKCQELFDNPGVVYALDDGRGRPYDQFFPMPVREHMPVIDGRSSIYRAEQAEKHRESRERAEQSALAADEALERIRPMLEALGHRPDLLARKGGRLTLPPETLESVVRELHDMVMS